MGMMIRMTLAVFAGMICAVSAASGGRDAQYADVTSNVLDALINAGLYTGGPISPCRGDKVYIPKGTYTPIGNATLPREIDLGKNLGVIVKWDPELNKWGVRLTTPALSGPDGIAFYAKSIKGVACNASRLVLVGREPVLQNPQQGDVGAQKRAEPAQPRSPQPPQPPAYALVDPLHGGDDMHKSTVTSIQEQFEP